MRHQPAFNTQLILTDVAQIMECNLDSKTILQIIENLCLKLTQCGEDYIMMTTNSYKQTSDVIASDQGREFMKQNTTVLQSFVKHCYNAINSSSTGYITKNMDEINMLQDSEQSASNQMKGKAFQNYYSETRDSNETENLDLNKMDKEVVQDRNKTVHDVKLRNTSEGNFRVQQRSTAKCKVNPQPKKRQRKKKLDLEKCNYLVKHQSSSKIDGLHSLDLPKKHVTSLLICEKCDDSFETKTLLNKHVRKIHNNKLSNVCPQKYISDTLLKKTDNKQTAVEMKGKKRCTVCNKNFQSKNSLKRHMYVHQKQKQYQCEDCLKIFWRPESYKSHLIFHKTPQHKCQVCEKIFYLKKSLAKHEELHTKQFKCRACMAVFKDRENYELHNCEQDDPSNFSRTYDSGITEDGKHICGICKKVFQKRRGLLTHRKLHSVVYTSHNSCGLCNKSYRTKNSLKKHMKVVHTETRDFICDLCGKSFKRQDTLNAHMRIHDSNRTEYQCKECDKYLSAPAALKVHMRLHQKLKPFMCDVCGVSFSQRGNLSKHMLSHTNKTNFTCEQCGKEFKYQETWKTHMRSHALKAGLQDCEVLAFGKFYVCEICQKKVASASQYKVHMRTHTNERPYPCTYCGKCFKESGKLSRHMRIHRAVKHDEHNYVSSKVTKGKKNGPCFVNIAMKQDTNQHSMSVERDANEILVENVMVSNSVPKSDCNQHNINFFENSYTGDASSESYVIIKDSPPPTNESQIRVIDDSRHQFLMHQLTPAANLIMESSDGRHIQVPSTGSLTEMHIMEVEFDSCSRTSHSNPLEASIVPNNQMIQGNPTTLNNLMPFTKYFQP